MKDKCTSLNKQARLPRVVAEVTVKELGDEIVLFRKYGKDVIALDSNLTKIYHLCADGASFSEALSSVTREDLFRGLSSLRERNLLAPDYLPSVNLEQWQSTEISNERLVYIAGLNQALLLDEVTNIVWTMCDGETTVDRAVENLRLRFSLDEEAAEEIVWAALANLSEKSLVLSPLPAALSRRSFVKRWATAAALFPVIASALTPSPAAASSTECIVNGNAGCAARFPSGRVDVCCPCTANPAPPCTDPGPNLAEVCVVFRNVDGTSCLDDSLGGTPFCNTIEDFGVPGLTLAGRNSQVDCAASRASAILSGFTAYTCCFCT